MAHCQEKRRKEGRSVNQTNCQGIKISRTVSIKHTCKNHNTIDDSQLNAVKNKKGKWSKLRRDISNAFKTKNVEKHSSMVKSQSLKQVLKIEENNEKQKPEAAAVSKNGVKMRRMRSVKMKQREGKSEAVEGNQELCKKRILMGGKCKPLNVSGVLHYDQNGILLPEDVL